MKRLLIVEDEKMIRQGLRVMIQRAPVEVEEILDCANGEEALALLRKTPVDVLFTDVRMPKMDGISLIQKLDELPHPPLTVVISGYDEFSYAVEALRCGAKDYLLKPVSREDISRVLCALEEQVQKRGRQMESCHLLKYVLLNPDATQHEWEAARAMFHSLVGEGDFWAVATRRLGAFERPLVCMEKMGRPGCLYLLAEEDCLPEEVPEAVYCGISGPHKGFDAFPLACRQAREAWFSAFFTGSSQRRWKDLGTQCACFFTKETAQRLALLLGTEKTGQTRDLLEPFLEAAAKGAVRGGRFYPLDRPFAGRDGPAVRRHAGRRAAAFAKPAGPLCLRDLRRLPDRPLGRPAADQRADFGEPQHPAEKQQHAGGAEIYSGQLP